MNTRIAGVSQRDTASRDSHAYLDCNPRTLCHNVFMKQNHIMLILSSCFLGTSMTLGGCMLADGDSANQTDSQLQTQDLGIGAPPDLSVPARVYAAATSVDGARVSYEVSAKDADGDEVEVVCEPASESVFAPGRTAVVCAAEDATGERTEQRFPVSVQYEWRGPLLLPDTPRRDPAPPRTNQDAHRGDNTFVQGDTVRVRFWLEGDSRHIRDAAAALYYAPEMGVPGMEFPAQSADRGADEPWFDHHGSYYQYRWATTDVEPGTYELRIKLDDEVERTASVHIEAPPRRR